VIPYEDIEAIEIRPLFSAGDNVRVKGFQFSFPLKIDVSDFFRHIAIKRKKGIFRHIRFTPDNPDKFLSVVQSHLSKIASARF
jgi:hypothetical protein